MTTKSWDVKFGTGRYAESFYQQSFSNMIAGRVDTTAQTYYRRNHVKCTTLVADPSGWQIFVRDASNQTADDYFNWSVIDNTARARFLGKIKKGSASMGVTIASWKQSREMIHGLMSNTAKRLDAVASRLERNPKRRNRLKRDSHTLASAVLEGEFGWKPLIQDVNAALTTVIQGAIPPQFVRGSHRVLYGVVEGLVTSGDYRGSRTLKDGWARSTVAGPVIITNPNLWLANRLGLINPGVVAWDLVPWSFVVNMFVNIDRIIGSVTDFVGLDVSRVSTTRTSSVYVDDLFTRVTGDPPVRRFAHSGNNYRTKARDPGTIPAVHLDFKVPDVNWELAVIACSLVIQKVAKINNLIGKTAEFSRVVT